MNQEEGTLELVADDFLYGLQASPLVRQVKGFKDQRERSVVATNPLNRSLQMEKTLVLKK